MDATKNNNGSYIFGDFQRTNQYDAKSRTTAAFVSAELKLNDTWKISDWSSL